MNNFLNKVINRTLRRTQEIPVKPFRPISVFENSFIVPNNFMSVHEPSLEIENVIQSKNQPNNDTILHEKHVNLPLQIEKISEIKKQGNEKISSEKKEIELPKKLEPLEFSFEDRKEIKKETGTRVLKNSKKIEKLIDEPKISELSTNFKEVTDDFKNLLKKPREKFSHLTNYRKPVSNAETGIKTKSYDSYNTGKTSYDKQKIISKSDSSGKIVEFNEAYSPYEDGAMEPNGNNKNISQKQIETFEKNSEHNIAFHHMRTRNNHSADKRDVKAGYDVKPDQIVNITIENIDVRAITSLQQDNRKKIPKTLSLEDYMRQKGGSR